MRDPRPPRSPDGYERPQQTWQCGLAEEGHACPLGPSAGGHCPAAAACHPVREGDRWLCNRSALRGGPCEDGPGHDGSCAIVYRCTPARALRTRRGRFAGGFAVAAIGAACMALGSSWRNELIAPGPLSVHHAQLLVGERATLRCAQCHAAGGATVQAWVQHTSGSSELTSTQSVLCLECHGKLVASQWATASHGVDPSTLLGAERPSEPGGSSPRPDRQRDPHEPVACAACHREHQGAHHNLAAMTNEACQACHRERYDSFASGHPDFGAWPYQKPARIMFDHASHKSKHFPAEKQSFACSACHEADASGELQLTRDYAASCGACHDKSIAASTAGGLTLLSLPTLDTDALRESGRDIGPWPEDASGDFEGSLPLIAKLLIAANERGSAALRVLGPNFDFFDVDAANEKQLAAAADVAQSLRTIIDSLADGGSKSIAERVQQLLGRELTAAEASALGGDLSPELARAYRQRWFAAESDPARQDGNQTPHGNWSQDEATLSLKRQAIGHADPWLRAWLDVMAEAASGPRATIVEPLLEAALKPTAPGLCGSCHALDRNTQGKLSIEWTAFEPDRSRREFTRFDHGPHVGLATLGDCGSCHHIAETAATPSGLVADFAPMKKQLCVACHTSAAAGDNCTQCHRYHVSSGQ